MDLEDIATWIGINSLFARYALALDNGDVAGIVACFHPDGSLESPVLGKIVGHAALTVFAERFAGLNRGGAQLRHVITNLQVTGTGAAPTAIAYLTTMLTEDGKTRLLPPGVYQCAIVKHEGEWVFMTRMLRSDAAYTLPFK